MKQQIETEIRNAIQRVIGTYNIQIPEVVVEQAGVAVMEIIQHHNGMAKIPTPENCHVTFGDITPQTQTSK